MVRYKVFTDIKIHIAVSKMVTNVYEEATVHPKHWCPSTNYIMATEDGILIHSNLTSQLISI
jgi:ABC-type tungstate transport system permease subunit